MTSQDADSRKQRAVIAFHTAADWVRMVHMAYGAAKVDDAEVEWFGHLAQRADVLIRCLDRFDDRGELRLPDDVALSFFRFELIEHATTVLASDLGYGWANALEAYNDPLSWTGIADSPSPVAQSRDNRVGSLADAVLDLRHATAELQRGFQNQASPLAVGRLLHDFFIDASLLLVFAEKDLRWRDE